MARKKTANFKMKGHTLPGINQKMDKSSNPDGRAKSSAFQKKPTAAELRDAANNPRNPNHPSKFKTRAEYEAWKAGGRIVPTAPESKTYHGAGGKVMNPDGTVNEELTKENVKDINIT